MTIQFGTNCSDQKKFGDEYFCHHVKSGVLGSTICKFEHCPICIISDTFEHNIKLYNEIYLKLDTYVWRIFSRYVNEFEINFNRPDWWRVDGPDIHFEGEDGCCGCYDSMSLDIPMQFFIDTQKAFDERHEVIRIKRENEILANNRKAMAKSQQTEQSERELYEVLKKKFGDV